MNRILPSSAHQSGVSFTKQFPSKQRQVHSSAKPNSQPPNPISKRYQQRQRAPAVRKHKQRERPYIPPGSQAAEPRSSFRFPSSRRPPSNQPGPSEPYRRHYNPYNTHHQPRTNHQTKEQLIFSGKRANDSYKDPQSRLADVSHVPDDLERVVPEEPRWYERDQAVKVQGADGVWAETDAVASAAAGKYDPRGSVTIQDHEARKKNMQDLRRAWEQKNAHQFRDKDGNKKDDLPSIGYKDRLEMQAWIESGEIPAADNWATDQDQDAAILKETSERMVWDVLPTQHDRDQELQEAQRKAELEEEKKQTKFVVREPKAYQQKRVSTLLANKSFQELGVSSSIVKNLNIMACPTPTHVQAAALKTMASWPRHSVIADQAGSGKTLAYLLPVVNKLVRDAEKLTEQAGQGAAQFARIPNAPKVVILTPTGELSQQIVRVATALSAGHNLRIAEIATLTDFHSQHQALRDGVDILVGTPGKVAGLVSSNRLNLTFVTSLVLDEVDVIMSQQTHSDAHLVLPMKAMIPNTASFVFVTATLPEQFYVKLEEEFPGLQLAVGPNLHRNPPRLLEELVDCSGGEHTNEEAFRRKSIVTKQLITHHGKKRVIVFCNKTETCGQVSAMLKEHYSQEKKDVQVLQIHKQVDREIRKHSINAFLSEPSALQSDVMVLVTTDRFAQGIDTRHVEHVVLFDFVRDPSEYVRRVGRTARGVEGTGIVSVLCMSGTRMVAQELLRRNQDGRPIHEVPRPMEVYRRTMYPVKTPKVYGDDIPGKHTGRKSIKGPKGRRTGGRSMGSGW